MTGSLTDRRFGLAEGLAVKAPCRCATTANITLNGLQTIDAIAVAEGDRVLVKNQTDATQNGVYAASSGNWTRDSDFDGNRDIVQGSRIWVIAGAVNFLTDWYVTAANPITIGTTAITFGKGQQDSTATAADRVQTGLDRASADGDAVATAADRAALTALFAVITHAAFGGM